ncbi:NAD(P)H-dependent oxidoreductase [Streptomyces hokutonensis]|uniref:NAD(P)H-dependent oxidoreductase n=1 Tax=Streptomyces hokutonensis TaxID=1306990 RepID=UPI000372B4E6|nr:NAD(P)H-dependent oxidoreductase [Streptomyces hokutonensis]
MNGGDPTGRDPNGRAPTGANVAVIYHSRKGTVRSLAAAVASGAEAAGASVRLRSVREEAGGPGAEPADLADLVWADAVVWGTPTHYGNVSVPLKEFIDSTGPAGLWSAGSLANLAVSALTSSTSLNGGQEGTLLSLHRTMYHWGALVTSGGAPEASADDWHDTGGNPYGLSVCADPQGRISPSAEAAARTLGARMTGLAARVRPLRPSRARPSRPRAGGAQRLLIVFQQGDRRLRGLADALALGAAEEGAEIRLRQVDGDETGLRHADGDEATPADVEWADGIAWGMRSRTGVLPSPLAAFVERTQRELPGPGYRGKAVTAFGTTLNAHAGGESTLLSAYTAMHQWDAVVLAPGYTDPVVNAAGGNPYGTLHHAGNGPSEQSAAAAAHYQGRRFAIATAALATPPRTPHDVLAVGVP